VSKAYLHGEQDGLVILLLEEERNNEDELFNTTTYISITSIICGSRANIGAPEE
jgi:hypothetical protein